MNGEYLKAMDFDKYWELAEPRLKDAVKTEGIDLRFVGELLKTRLETLNDIPSLIDFIDELPRIFHGALCPQKDENYRGDRP